MEESFEHGIALNVSASLVLFLSCSRMAWCIPGSLRRLWKRLPGGKSLRNQREESLSNHICQQKTALSQKFFWYAQFWISVMLAYILWNSIRHGNFYMKIAGHWCVVVALGFLLFFVQFPQLLSYKTSLDTAYVLLQLFVALMMSPWTFRPGGLEVSLLNSMCFVMLSLPAAASARHCSVVLLCQSGICILNSVRAITEESIEHPVFLILFSFCHIPMAVLVFQLVDALMLREAESKMRESDSRIQMNAAGALLQLTCDAVLELDPELRLVDDNPGLNTMLLGRPGASLKGRCFTDFMPSNEQPRATELLHMEAATGRPTHQATAFHTRLVDSYSSKFRTEVFQVKYTRMNGQKCHLLGLRDFTDQKSLALHAIDARPAAPPALSPLPLVTHSRSQHSQRSRSSGGSECSENSCLSEASGSPEARLPPVEALQRHVLNSGIVEQRLKLSHKEAFLEIDVAQQVVTGASAPFSSLCGRSLTEVFATDFSRDLFHRMVADAQRTLEEGALKDQVAAFHKMPLLTSGSMVEVSGVLKVWTLRDGELRVVMCCVADGSKWRGTLCPCCKSCSQWSL